MKPILAKPDNCTGCSACYAVCPKNAISMNPDEEGFLHPCIDTSVCIGCGLCEKTCPLLHGGIPSRSKECYAAKARDSESQYKSASGGVFFELAANIIALGGCVYGCAYDKKLVAHHVKVQSLQELAALRDSKYVQSDQRDALREAVADLNAGRTVLYSGTSCQIAGLTAIVGCGYENLLRVELTCHGVPSPALFQKFKQEKEVEKSAELVYVSFRSKSDSWLRHRIRMRFSSGDELECPYSSDPYVKAFEHRFGNRPSCHNCQTREGFSGADLTIGDYWGVQETHPGFFSDYGVSFAIVRTPKGLSALREAGLELLPTTYGDILRKNPDIEKRSPLPLSAHKKFYKKVRRSSIAEAVESVSHRSFLRRAASRLFKMIGMNRP